MKTRQLIRAWTIAAAILTLGTALCAILTAITFEIFIDRPEGGGSITTLLPGLVYATATVMKVCLVSCLVSAAIALIMSVSAFFKQSDLASNEGPKSVLPTWAILSVSLTPLAQLVAALAVVIAQTLVDKPEGVSMSYFPQLARTGVLVMLSHISIAGVAAVTSLVRREGFCLLSILGLVINVLIIGLFWHFEFYALGFDQDTWALRL
jgi:hypothetical protein